MRKRGQAPKEVKRVDKAHQKGGQDHIHFKDGSSMNKDGSIHDAHRGKPKITNDIKDWLNKNGWDSNL